MSFRAVCDRIESLCCTMRGGRPLGAVRSAPVRRIGRRIGQEPQLSGCPTHGQPGAARRASDASQMRSRQGWPAGPQGTGRFAAIAMSDGLTVAPLRSAPSFAHWHANRLRQSDPIRSQTALMPRPIAGEVQYCRSMRPARRPTNEFGTLWFSHLVRQITQSDRWQGVAFLCIDSGGLPRVEVLGRIPR